MCFSQIITLHAVLQRIMKKKKRAKRLSKICLQERRSERLKVKKKSKRQKRAEDVDSDIDVSDCEK